MTELMLVVAVVIFHFAFFPYRPLDCNLMDGHVVMNLSKFLFLSVVYVTGHAHRGWYMNHPTCHIHVDMSQVYIPKRRTLIQVLPPANAYTKSPHPYIHFAEFFCYLLMYVCIFIAIRPVCIHHGVHIGCLIAILRQIAYMHEQIT